MQPSVFGGLLRQYRTQAGFSQSELAKLIGFDKSYISRLERGERDVPSRDIILNIINVIKLGDYEANSLLLISGYAPINENTSSDRDPILGLINDIFQDDRITEAELSPLREYARLLDQLRKQR